MKYVAILNNYKSELKKDNMDNEIQFKLFSINT